ncbi:MAG: Lrp/AsnC family transcriptional regulator [Candidatus Bathyarchaeia archaeon]
MDETDIKILKELVADARVSYNELARRVGVSVGTIVNRVQDLEKRGVIKGYSAILDAEKMGYYLAAIIEIIVSKGKLHELEKEVTKNPNVYGVYNVTGRSDVMAVARFKSKEELSEFVKSLLSSDFVDRTPNPRRPRSRERGLPVSRLGWRRIHEARHDPRA